MRTVIVLSILAAGELALSMNASAQSPEVDKGLHDKYTPTVMGSNNQVVRPGSTLAVQMDGILANPVAFHCPYANVFADGQVKPDNCLKCQLCNRTGAARALPINEQAYLLRVDINKDNVVFEVQTCGSCNPKSVDPTHKPFRAQVTFKFVKGSLGGTDFQQVQQVIGQVFSVPESSTYAPIAAPGQPDSPMASSGGTDGTASPAPAPADTERKLEIGQTTDQVRAILGEPDKILSLGSKIIYVYKDVKVTFIDGKVSDIE